MTGFHSPQEAHPQGEGEGLVHSPSAHTQPGAAKTVADILTAAADLIEPEGAWTQGEQARNANGSRIADFSPAAVCFCASGSIWRAAQKMGIPALSGPKGELIDKAHHALIGVIRAPVPTWNDAPERTQTEVVAALRAAAERTRTAAEPGSVGTTEGRAPKPAPTTGEA